MPIKFFQRSFITSPGALILLPNSFMILLNIFPTILAKIINVSSVPVDTHTSSFWSPKLSENFHYQYHGRACRHPLGLRAHLVDMAWRMVICCSSSCMRCFDILDTCSLETGEESTRRFARVDFFEVGKLHEHFSTLYWVRGRILKHWQRHMSIWAVQASYESQGLSAS